MKRQEKVLLIYFLYLGFWAGNIGLTALQFLSVLVPTIVFLIVLLVGYIPDSCKK